MTQIRVLRILEYTYESPERAELDQAHWTQSFAAPNGSMTMRSVSLPFSTLPDPPTLESTTCYECGLEGTPSSGFATTYPGERWRHMDCPNPPADAIVTPTTYPHCPRVDSHGPHLYYSAKQVIQCLGHCPRGIHRYHAPEASTPGICERCRHVIAP